MLRVFWRCVHQPIFTPDSNLPKAEHVRRLQKMILALLYGEARLTRVIHAAARRMCGLPPLRAPLQAYMRRKPRNVDALFARINIVRRMLQDPMRRARALARRMHHVRALPHRPTARTSRRLRFAPS